MEPRLMDGMANYSMAGAIEVGRSTEDAVDRAMVYHGYKAKEAVNG